MVKFWLFGELVNALVAAFAVYMEGASEGEFTYAEVGKVYDLVPDTDFRTMVENGSEFWDMVDDDADQETLELIVIKFANAVNAPTTKNYLELNTVEASLLTQFVAVLVDGDQGGPLF